MLRIAIAASAIIALLASPGRCANVCNGDISELIDFSKLPCLRDSVCTMVSSYDRTGGNDDGFSGRYSYIRVEDGKQVIFDADGPGCIYRIWSAKPNEQKLEFFFDGAPTAGLTFQSFQDMFQGKVYPFLPPVSQHFIGGWCSYVPIPFEKHLKIVSHGQTQFLQITWHKFPSADGVKTFSTGFSEEHKAGFESVRKVWSDPGSAPWADRTPPEWRTHEIDLTIEPGKSLDMLKLSGAGVVRAMYLTVGSDDPRHYRGAVLEARTDGNSQPDVWCPVGDFFLDGFGWPAGRSILAGKRGGEYYGYWPMPFAKGIRIGIDNGSARPLVLRGRIVVEPMGSLPEGMGRFFAWWHRQDPTRTGKGFEILTARGRGHWCGVNHYMQGTNSQISYLEGDEKAWIDDRDNSYFNGTGTEDYFNGGWYFGALGSAPLYGCLALSDGGTCDAYRFHLTDVVPFQKKAHVEIEHGGADNHPSDYAGTTFWYAEPGTVHTFRPVSAEDRQLGPRKDDATLEAEQGFLGGGPYVQIEYDKSPVQYSQGKAVACYAKQPGGLIKCKVGIEATSQYEIRAQVLCGPDCGTIATYVDGKQVGRIVDCYSDVRELRVRTLAASTPYIHASGDHVLTFRVVGKSAESRGSNQAIDAIYLTRLGLIEGENMRVTASPGAAYEVQRTASIGPGWSGDTQLLLTGETGSAFDLEMPVEQPGRYFVGAYFEKGPKCGKIKLSLDNHVLEGELDLYDGADHHEPMMRFGGEYDLRAGKHTLRVEVIGRNEKSKGYLVGLDAMSLEPTNR